MTKINGYIANLIRVSPSTVERWLAGESRPHELAFRPVLKTLVDEIERLRKILLAATNLHSASCAINLQWRRGVYPPCDCGVSLDPKNE